MAGAASVDITPPVGVLLDGYGARTKSSEGVHDPLFARVLVSTTVMRLRRRSSDAICWGCTRGSLGRCGGGRRQAYGIPGDAIIVSVPHNHAGPAGLREGMFARLDEGLAEEVAAKIVARDRQAWKTRRVGRSKLGRRTSIRWR